MNAIERSNPSANRPSLCARLPRRWRRGRCKPMEKSYLRESMSNVDRLLDGIHYPADMRQLTVEQLVQLAQEIREEVISIVSEVGGHFASTLGAVDLTLALHYVFNTPDDRIV